MPPRRSNRTSKNGKKLGRPRKVPVRKPSSRRRRSSSRTTRDHSPGRVPSRGVGRPSSPTSPHRVREGASSKGREVSQNLWELLGGRDGVVSLLPVDPKDLKASTLRDALFDENHVGADGTLKGRFDSLYLQAGYSARDLFELFDSRQHATALVVASAAKPRLVGELVDAASQRVVPCDECGGTMLVARTDPDGEFLEWVQCTVQHCDDRGNVLIDGNKAARELYFDQFGFKQSAPFVSIDARSDNRKVEFHVGMQGTAPSPLALIRALETVPDVDAPSKKTLPELPEPSVVDQQRVMSGIVEAEVIGK